jgi:hypothetical protein
MDVWLWHPKVKTEITKEKIDQYYIKLNYSCLSKDVIKRRMVKAQNGRWHVHNHIKNFHKLIFFKTMIAKDVNRHFKKMKYEYANMLIHISNKWNENYDYHETFLISQLGNSIRMTIKCCLRPCTMETVIPQ